MIEQGIATAEELDALEKEDVDARARGAAPRLGGLSRSRSTPRCRKRSAASTRSPAALGAQRARSDRDELQRNQAPVPPRRRARRCLGADRRASRAARTTAAADWLRASASGEATSATTRISTARAIESALQRRRKCRPSTPTTRRWSTASRSSTPASTRRCAAIRASIIFGEDVGKLGDVNQGCARPAGEVRHLARHATPASASARSSARPSAWRMRGLRPDRRDPVSRLHAVRAADPLRRPGHAALAHRAAGRRRR